MLRPLLLEGFSSALHPSARRASLATAFVIRMRTKNQVGGFFQEPSPQALQLTAGSYIFQPHLFTVLSFQQSVSTIRFKIMTTRADSPDGRERIVIVGSGWAGYNVSQNLDDRKFNITVISPEDTSPYTPLLVCFLVTIIWSSLTR